MRQHSFDLYPQGQTGIGLIPNAGVVTGFTVSLAGAANSGVLAASAPNPAKAQVSVSAGTARFDGVEAKLLSNTTVTLSVPEAIDLEEDDYTVEVWLNPTYKIPALTSAPATPSAGDKYLKVSSPVQLETANKSSVRYVEGMYTYSGSAWVAMDALSGISQPIKNSQNHAPFGEYLSTLTASNFATAPDSAIIIRPNLPPYIAQAVNNTIARQANSILLAVISYTGGVGTITSTLADYYKLPI